MAITAADEAAPDANGIAQLHNGTISLRSYLNYAEQAIPVMKALVANLTAQSRLHIPYINIGNGVNGPTLRGVTLFPPIFSMSESWNRELYISVIAAMREEFYACGINWVLSPELDIAANSRYGRMGELYGVYPYLNDEFGLIFVNTMQSLNTKGYMKVATTIKRYVCGQELGGVNGGSVNGGPNHIFNYLATPFIKIFKNAILCGSRWCSIKHEHLSTSRHSTYNRFYPLRCGQARVSVLKYTANFKRIKGLQIQNLTI
ncbi:hypothetical protein G7Y89_g8619 [Cudoniella acicularis]|uniref:beta-glucosidase n=1 Tax=Cudoniella acicularis TaxID=354080 RepID=A0A8H4RH59_9HELO|nr:hypothetical protein G7Y89_g8619 [Cudoniella acicularis]